MRDVHGLSSRLIQLSVWAASARATVRPMSRDSWSGVLVLCACGSGHGAPVDAAHRDAPVDAPAIPTGVVAVPLTSLGPLSDYTGPLHIGSQLFAAVVDTGSTTLGIAGSDCTSCGVAPLYTPGPGAVDQHAIGSHQYVDSGWSGEIWQDALTLGSAADVPVDFVAIASSYGGYFPGPGETETAYQGTLGLGPDALLLSGTSSYLQQSFAAGVTPEFAFQLCPQNGTMWIGGVDGSAEAAAPVTTALLGDGFPFYAVTIDSIAVGSGAPIGSAGDYGPVVVDTGTSVSLIPTAQLTQLIDAIQADAGYTSIFGDQSLGSAAAPGCVVTAQTGADIDAALPPFHVSWPGSDGEPSAYADLPATKSYLLFDGSTGSGSDNEWCLAFEDGTLILGDGNSLLGNSLMSSLVAVFDLGNQQMQFAPSQGCAEADAVAPARARAPRFVPGVPWWQQDPRVRMPGPDRRAKIAAFLH
jgi:hypothetical protein